MNDSMTLKWWNYLPVSPQAMKACSLSKSRNLWGHIPCWAFPPAPCGNRVWVMLWNLGEKRVFVTHWWLKDIPNNYAEWQYKINVYLKHHLSTPTAMYMLVTWRYCSPHTMHHYICTSLYPYSPHHTDHYIIHCVLQKTHGYCAFVPPPQYNLLKLLKVGFKFITNL